MILQGRLKAQPRSNAQNLLNALWSPCKAPLKFLKGIGEFLFPPVCASCGAQLERQNIYSGLCLGCQAGIKTINGPLCEICGRPFITRTGDNHRCGACILTPPPFSKAFSLFDYDGPVKSLIKKIKFNENGYALKTLGALARKHLGESFEKPEIIVPVPLHPRRLRKRGFNQSVRLSREIFPDAEIMFDLLLKVKDTLPQTFLSAKERRNNLRGAFSMGRSMTPQVKKVVILDDVLTTGTTVSECVKALKKGGANHVEVFTVARSLPKP